MASLEEGYGMKQEEALLLGNWKSTHTHTCACIYIDRSVSALLACQSGYQVYVRDEMRGSDK